MKHSLCFLLFTFLVTNTLSAQLASPAKTIIKDVNIISPDRPEILQHQDVFIEKGKIKKIKPTTEGKAKGYEVVNGAEKYLIPGMADMHAHLPNPQSPMQYREYYLCNLLNGVTTVRQMRGKPNDLIVRDSIRKGLMLGCNTYISYPPFFFMDDNNESHFSATMCRDSFIKFRKQGYDFAKYLWLPDVKQYDTFMSIAASLNIKATGHAPSNDLAKAVAADQYTIEHIPPVVTLYQTDTVIFWKTIDKMVLKGLYYCPDVRYYIMDLSQTSSAARINFTGKEFLKEGVSDTHEKDFYENSLAAYKRNPLVFAKNILRDSANVSICMALLPHLQAKGVKLLISPADGEFFVPGFSYIDEMELFIKAGISPIDAIKCATYNAADCLGTLDKNGTITEGKQADMVLLSANPLENISNLRKVDATILNGQVLTREYLLDQLKK